MQQTIAAACNELSDFSVFVGQFFFEDFGKSDDAGEGSANLVAHVCQKFVHKSNRLKGFFSLRNKLLFHLPSNGNIHNGRANPHVLVVWCVDRDTLHLNINRGSIVTLEAQVTGLLFFRLDHVQ